MSLASVIKQFMNKTAYHWYDPVPNGRGRFTFGGVQTLTVRWKKTNQVVQNYEGQQVNASAEVWTYEPVQAQEMLKLDDGTDVDSSSTGALEEGAYEVQSIETVEDIDGSQTIMWKAFV